MVVVCWSPGGVQRVSIESGEVRRVTVGPVESAGVPVGFGRVRWSLQGSQWNLVKSGGGILPVTAKSLTCCS